MWYPYSLEMIHYIKNNSVQCSSSLSAGCRLFSNDILIVMTYLVCGILLPQLFVGCRYWHRNDLHQLLKYNFPILLYSALKVLSMFMRYFSKPTTTSCIETVRKLETYVRVQYWRNVLRPFA